MVTVLCLTGCRSHDTRAASTTREDARAADLDAHDDWARMQAAFTSARYSRILSSAEQDLLIYMISQAIPPDPDPSVRRSARNICTAQLHVCALYSNDPAQPWKINWCGGDPFLGHAPAVIEAVGPDDNDGVPVTATLTIGPGHVDSFAIRRADGSKVMLPDESEFHKWRVTARGNVYVQ
jgi:hypothetical protein